MDRVWLFVTDLVTRDGRRGDDSLDGRELQQLRAHLGTRFERDRFCERLWARARTAGAV
jgi:hypothetical protein